MRRKTEMLPSLVSTSASISCRLLARSKIRPALTKYKIDMVMLQLNTSMDGCKGAH